MTALGRALQGAAVQDDCGGLGGTSLAQSDQFPQVGDDGFEHLGGNPAAGLVVDGMPGRQVMRHVAPLEPSPGM